MQVAVELKLIKKLKHRVTQRKHGVSQRKTLRKQKILSSKKPL
jgi:hypothetical protein